MSRRRQRGFSLLELLVAFAIMAMSLGLLYRLVGGSLRHVGDMVQTQHAVWLAESVLAGQSSLDASGWNEDGESRGIVWAIRSTPIKPNLSEGEPDNRVRLHEVRFTAHWQGNARPGSLEVLTLLPQRPPRLGEARP